MRSASILTAHRASGRGRHSPLRARSSLCGRVPTPALALAGLARVVPSIMVTGSHIPFDRNGIKFYTPRGEISKQDEQPILDCRGEPA